MASGVEAIIPPNTTAPMACWLAAHAPEATISGTPRVRQRGTRGLEALADDIASY